MAQFSYKAKNAEGRVLEGTLEAESEDQARVVLRGRRFTVLEIAKSKGAGKGIKVKDSDVVIFSRQLATMQAAGLPLVQAIGIIAEQATSKNLQSVLRTVREDVSSGGNFSEALAKHPRAFSGLYVNMVKAGEQGGNLDVILERLSSYMEKAQALKSKIIGAMTYPVVIIGVMLGILVFLMVGVVPTFKEVFKSFNAKLPAPTRFLLFISDTLINNWIFGVVGIPVLIFGYKAFSKTPYGEKTIDSLMLKLPLMGDMLRKVATARFARTLGTLQKSGVPILDGMDIVAKTAGNKIIESAIFKARASIREGEGISGPLRAVGVFPPMVIQMVSAGEETGKLDEMLVRIADFYDTEVDQTVETLMKLIEPLTMVVLGSVVGLIVLAMYLPMFQMGQMAGA